MGIEGIFNVEIGQRSRAALRRLYQETLQLAALPDSCPAGRFSVSVGAAGSPMSGILTFAGSGTLIQAVTFAVARNTLPMWDARLSERKTTLVGRAWQFDEEYLCFLDGSGFDLALAEIDGPSEPGDADRVLGIRSVEIVDGPSGELQKLLETIGLEAHREEGPVIRFALPDRSNLTAIDIFRSSSSPVPHPAIQRAAQRISFKVSDTSDIALLRQKLTDAGFETLSFCQTSGLKVRLRSQPGFEIGVLCTAPTHRQTVHL